MSTLVAVAYPNRDTAEQVRQELIRATKEHLVQLDDAVIVEQKPDGKIKLHQAMSTTGAGAAGGALIALGSTDARDKLIDRVKSYGGDVIQTSLDAEAEEHLRAALGEPTTA
jgi:uncharacterized membrane protein